MNTAMSMIMALALAGTAAAQQASITLRNSDVALCHHNNTDWNLTKTVTSVSEDESDVTWDVTATRGATSANYLSVNGFVAVQNTGTADATIGNIVVNLQRQRVVSGKNRWVSASVDAADATNGDAATSANIVAAASQETPAWNAFNNYNNPATYAVSGAKGTFKENTASGALEFTDADNNTIWAITRAQLMLLTALKPTRRRNSGSLNIALTRS